MDSLSRTKDGLFGLLMLAASLGLVAQSLSYHDESAHFPRFLAYTLAGLSLLYLALWWRRGKAASSQTRPDCADADAAPLISPWARLCAGVLLFMAAYLLGISWLGYYAASTLFLAAGMFWFSRAEVLSAGLDARGLLPPGRPVTMLLAIGLFLCLTWLLFTRFLGTRMPEGLLF